MKLLQKRWKTNDAGVRFSSLPHAPVVFGGAGRVRIWPLKVLLFSLGFLLVGRLFQLTVVEGKWRRSLAEDNRILALPLLAPRGGLLDRNGVALTQNVPVYRRQVPGTSPAALAFETIDRDEALRLLSDPNERISYSILRQYPCGVACAPVVGYVAEAGADELEQMADYGMGDWVGRSGAEKVLERLLKGVRGEEYVEINARGMATRTVGLKEPQSGSTVTLTIDQGLQQRLYQAFEGKAGAAVVLAAQTGEVLAMVNSPTFDPNLITESLSQPNQPFFNRSLSGNYAPGSTFKLVTATAALEDEKITAETTFQDTGELVVGSYRYGNWLYDEHGRTEGEVDVVRAIARSNDIFFYQIGGLVGPESLARWAELFGFGSTWGLESWGASKGLVPTPAWKQEVKLERWYLGNTYHMSIGQGDVLATPMQVAMMTAAIARGGVVCPPQFVMNNGDVALGASPNQACQQLNLHESTIELLQQGMELACQPGGTGVPFFTYSIPVGCKTGTAQQGGEDALPHAWFTMYAPAINPEIVVTVLVEQGGQGSTVAAPIAKVASDYWFGFVEATTSAQVAD